MSSASSLSSTATLTSTRTPPAKDYAAAFGALQSIYGTSGAVPTPVTSQTKKTGESFSFRKVLKRSKRSETDSSSKSPYVTLPSSASEKDVKASLKPTKQQRPRHTQMYVDARHMGSGFGRLGAL